MNSNLKNIYLDIAMLEVFLSYHNSSFSSCLKLVHDVIEISLTLNFSMPGHLSIREMMVIDNVYKKKLKVIFHVVQTT